MARSKFERRAHKELEKKGWIVDYKIRPSGFRTPSNYQVDYFGLYDLLAYKGGELRWIAVKGQMGVPGELRKSIENHQIPKGNHKEIWYYRKLKGKRGFIPKKQRYVDGEWETI